MEGITNPRQVLVAAALAFASLMALSTTAPASAETSQPDSDGSAVSVAAALVPPGTPGPFRIQNVYNGLCLDSSTDRSVYFGRCNRSDPGQRWGWWNGGWLIQLSTGRCVEHLSNIMKQADFCSTGHAAQFWTQINQAIRNTGSGLCANGTDNDEGQPVFMGTCRTTLEQAWSVQYW
jgi:hypothetical protein